jgi:hypothetical protein
VGQSKIKKGKKTMATLLAPSKTVIELKIGEIATISADALSSGRYAILSTAADQPTGMTSVAASATATIGPFAVVKYIHCEALTGVGFSFTTAPMDHNKLAVIGDVSNIRLIANAGVPDSTVGANTCGPGSLCIDTSNANLYVATGTKSAPTWKLITRAA